VDSIELRQKLSVNGFDIYSKSNLFNLFWIASFFIVSWITFESLVNSIIDFPPYNS
jgi:hypothetical protein